MTAGLYECTIRLHIVAEDKEMARRVLAEVEDQILESELNPDVLSRVYVDTTITELEPGIR